MSELKNCENCKHRRIRSSRGYPCMCCELLNPISFNSKWECVKDETDTMIIRGVARAGVHMDKDELIKALEYDRGQYEKGFHDGRMYVPPCPSNADRIRSMSDEELAEWICSLIIDRYIGVPVKGWLDWLKQEVTE